jgi:mono/diheme cytochrome c family protein
MRYFLFILAASIICLPLARPLANISTVSPHAPLMAERSKYLVIASGICPQPRNTKQAPPRYKQKINPLLATTKNIEKGKLLYQVGAKPTACKMCHGIRGNGNGLLARGLDPAPRNFTCKETMEALSEGQLFWIIKNGSKGTGMPSHKFTLSDNDIWQIIYYLKSFYL